MNSSENASTSVAKLRQKHGKVSTLLLSEQVLPKADIKDLLKQYSATIPQLINFCNKFTLPNDEYYFPRPDDSDSETLYLAVNDLANSVSKVSENSTDLAAEPHLGIVIEVLAKILWKEDVPPNAKSPSSRTKTFPIEDPDATNCESYGRIIYWLRLLKHHYALTCSTNNKYRNSPATIEIQKFFMVAISRPQPKNGLDLIKTVLFIFSEVVWYLETVRVRLAPLHNLVIFPGVHQ